MATCSVSLRATSYNRRVNDLSGKDDPYRKQATALTRTRPTKLLPRPTVKGFAARVALWSAAGLGLVAATPTIMGGVLLYGLIGVASVSELVISKRWYWRARRVVESMPFTIRHEPGNEKIPQQSGRAITSMAVVLDAEMSDTEIERVVRGAQHMYPSLTATDDVVGQPHPARVITFYGWPNEDADIIVLANLLDTWGREIHELYKTRVIVVRWRTYSVG